MGGLHAVVTDADVIGSPDVAKSFLSIHAQASLSVFSDAHLKKGAVGLACYPRYIVKVEANRDKVQEKPSHRKQPPGQLSKD